MTWWLLASTTRGTRWRRAASSTWWVPVMLCSTISANGPSWVTPARWMTAEHPAAAFFYGGLVTQVGLDELGPLGRIGVRMPPVEQPQRYRLGGEVSGQAAADGPGGPGDQQCHGRW